MGIKYLNNICNKYCNKSYTTINISKLSNKVILIDTNLYMYKFKKNNSLEIDFEIMCNKFIKYNIHPLFIFDGIPPQEKEYTIKKRIESRNKAQEKLQELNNKSFNKTNNNKIIKYRKQTTKLVSLDFIIIKNLIYKYNFPYITATNEADELCAFMNKLYNYIIMSEDMDLFVYGSSYIIKNPDFYKETLDIYDTHSIIKSLNFNSKYDFQWVCILAGTDYYSNNKFNIYVAICLYIMYIETNKSGSFIYWCYLNKLISIYEFNNYLFIFNKFNFYSQIT